MALRYRRLFTVGEANRLIPALRISIEEIFKKLNALKRKSEEIIREEGLSPESSELSRHLDKNPDVARLTADIRGLVDEIHSYGCLCKGLEQGLVDFPCLFDGEIVFLCWRYGEESVSHWHRIEDGFSGRKPLLQPNGGDEGNLRYH